MRSRSVISRQGTLCESDDSLLRKMPPRERGKTGDGFWEELGLAGIVMYIYLYLCIFVTNLCRLQVKNLDGEEQVCYNVCNLWATLTRQVVAESGLCDTKGLLTAYGSF